MRFPSGWTDIRAVLEGTPNPQDWDMAFDVCFRERLDARYLKPISVIRDQGTYLGEGFLILTIQCSLIEFLAALRLGLNHRPNAAHGVNNEYGSSKRLYKEFLLSEEPFKSLVMSDDNALTFYENIRCALVHEAQTKNGWRVWAASAGSVAIDFAEKYVNRDLLGDAIDLYIKDYRSKLCLNEDLQAAFIRKFQYIHDHH